MFVFYIHKTTCLFLNKVDYQKELLYMIIKDKEFSECL